MPTLQAAPVSAAVTISGADITVASTAGIWPGQIGWIFRSGVTTRRIKVTNVTSATVFRAKYEAQVGDDNFQKPSAVGATDAAFPGSSAAQDLSAYTTGTVVFDAQLVSTQPDYSKLLSPI